VSDRLELAMTMAFPSDYEDSQRCAFIETLGPQRQRKTMGSRRVRPKRRAAVIS
jgi:hypothetical protein